MLPAAELQGLVSLQRETVLGFHIVLHQAYTASFISHGPDVNARLFPGAYIFRCSAAQAGSKQASIHMIESETSKNHGILPKFTACTKFSFLLKGLNCQNMFWVPANS